MNSLSVTERKMGILAPLNGIHSSFVDVFLFGQFKTLNIRPLFENTIQIWRNVDVIIDPLVDRHV